MCYNCGSVQKSTNNHMNSIHMGNISNRKKIFKLLSPKLWYMDDKEKSIERLVLEKLPLINLCINIHLSVFKAFLDF